MNYFACISIAFAIFAIFFAIKESNENAKARMNILTVALQKLEMAESLLENNYLITAEICLINAVDSLKYLVSTSGLDYAICEIEKAINKAEKIQKNLCDAKKIHNFWWSC